MAGSQVLVGELSFGWAPGERRRCQAGGNKSGARGRSAGKRSFQGDGVRKNGKIPRMGQRQSKERANLNKLYWILRKSEQLAKELDVKQMNGCGIRAAEAVLRCRTRGDRREDEFH